MPENIFSDLLQEEYIRASLGNKIEIHALHSLAIPKSRVGLGPAGWQGQRTLEEGQKD